MPAARVFVDTNVLLYVHDRNERQKAAQALGWLRALTDQQIGQINLQVLNELVHVLLRKKWFQSPQVVFSVVDDFAALGDSPVGWNEITLARVLHHRLSYSWWDCLLLASALQLGCTHFLSEDLQDGQRIDGLTIVDPFAHSPQQVLLSR
jgi:predicted nucleic acid-binding protein